MDGHYDQALSLSTHTNFGKRIHTYPFSMTDSLNILIERHLMGTLRTENVRDPVSLLTSPHHGLPEAFQDSSTPISSCLFPVYRFAPSSTTTPYYAELLACIERQGATAILEEKQQSVVALTDWLRNENPLNNEPLLPLPLAVFTCVCRLVVTKKDRPFNGYIHHYNQNPISFIVISTTRKN